MADNFLDSRALIDDAAVLSGDESDSISKNSSSRTKKQINDENGDEGENEMMDSSDEDEDEDDEDEARKIREGFIVDDEEEEAEDGDSDQKRKKHHRKRHRDTNQPDEELDEDDLELLRENAGELPAAITEKSKFKRLKRGADEIEADSSTKGLTNMFSDDEANEEDEIDRKNESNNELDEEEDDLDDAMKLKQQQKASYNRDLVGEFDDFIEDDEFSEEDEDRDEKLARMRSARAKQSQFAQQSKIDKDKLDELYEIFGDGEEYAWALEAEDVEDEDDETKDNENQMDDENDEENEYDEDGNLISKSAKPESKILKNIFEYEELKEHLLTDKDEQIRTTDIPERYQILREGIKSYNLSDIDFKEKQRWVAESLFKENSTQFASESKKFLIEPFKKSVAKIVELISRENLEVPAIWNCRKDYTLYTASNDNNEITVEKLLNENDLWRIVRLDIDFHAIYEKRKTVESLFQSLNTVDLVYDDTINSINTITELQDLYDYLQFTYSSEIKNIQEKHLLDSTDKNKKKKIHSRFKLFERIKNDPIYNVVKEFGIDAEKFGDNVAAGQKIYLTDDNEKSPEELIVSYLSDSYFSTTESSINAIKQMYSQQLIHNPKLRGYLRLNYELYSKIDIELTEKGRSKITETSPYSDFKYAINRNPESFNYNPDLFLRMLEAESLGYVIIKIGLKTAESNFIDNLFNFMKSNGTSESSTKWNELRRECLNIAIKMIIPNIIMTIKEKIRDNCERILFFKVRDNFLKKIDQAPYSPFQSKGMTSRVLALTNGEGKKDSAVIGIAMDFDGTIAEHVKFDESIRDPEFERKLLVLIDRFKPEVIAVSGYNVNCTQLKKKVEEIVKRNNKTTIPEEDEYSNNNENEGEVEIPVLYVENETARMFEYSDAANEEFSDKPVVAKFCIGIARYVQSPLLEYIVLDDAITSIQIHKHQGLLSEHKLKEAIESIFVDITCLVGIKINDAVRSSYYSKALKYIAGLGLRKASNLIKNLESNGGSLIKREDLILKNLLTKNVFLNCAPFIEIPMPDRYDKDIELLDATRIHPEDYDLARKMASDALDLEEEDKAEIESSEGGIIGKLYEEGVEKLDDLLLEGYAKQLEERGHHKRTTLEMIKEELQNNYEELRKSFHLLNDVEVFEMLTSETRETFDNGVVVPVIIQKVDNRYLLCVTQNGILGNISRQNAVPYGDSTNLLHKFIIGQAVQAVVKNVEYNEFKAEFSLLKEDVVRAKSVKKGDRHKDLWDFEAENKDIKRKRDIESRENKGNKRILKHPYFRNFDARQAEDYLASRDNGEFVIRPSTKGNDHLTITWKIDNHLFQHIDVVEHDKPNEYSIGRTLQIDEFKYHDLDELSVSHMAELHNKVEAMKNHEKFRNEPVNDARDWLVRYSKANKNRSCYCFCFNRKSPGWFFLLFKLNDSTEKTYTWNVKALPNGYMLHKNTYPDMVHLCNGFKKLLQNQMKNTGASSNSRAHYQSSYQHGGYNNRYSGNNNGYDAGNYGNGYNSNNNYGGRF